MRGRGQPQSDSDGGRSGLAAFPAPARRLALACLVLLLGLDLTIAGICPFFGGDCLYGLFTLIAGPVLLSGLMGAHLPLFACGTSARLGLTAAGGVVLAGVVLAGHVTAVGLVNAADYGGVLVRPRLLAVGMGLAMAYYLGLAAISLLRPGRG